MFGVLLVRQARPDSFSSDDCEFLRQLSSHVALAAHQARLYGALQAAYQDLRQTQQTVMQQERLRALGQIASGIAHDINNALSPAALYAQSMLTHEQGLTERAREHLTVIQRAIEDVAQTVQRMRAFYMPRGLETHAAPIDVNQVLAQVIDLTRARWSNMPQERGVVVRVESDFAPRPAQGARRGERGARRADQSHAQRRRRAARWRRDHAAHARRCARQAKSSSKSQDNGVGMSETTRSRCLEPFFTTKGERGTGLGLAMVFGMMQRHGGELEIDSELGHGHDHAPDLPGRAHRRDAARTAQLTPPLPPLRILLIDDDPLLLKSLRDALEIDEHEVVTAEGGQAGIDEFARGARSRQARSTSVITDLGMPYVDGRKVAARMRQLDGERPHRSCSPAGDIA